MSNREEQEALGKLLLEEKVEYCQALHAMCERRIDEMKIPRGLWTPMYRTICEVGYEH